jgi:hypothetical protein
MTRFHTPPRTALLSAVALSNFSEFGLIVIAIASKQGLLDSQWSAALSLTIAVSFLFSTGMNMRIHDFYYSWYHKLRGFQSTRLQGTLPDTRGVRVIILGMGIIGTGAYDSMRSRYGNSVLGVDDSEQKLDQCRRHNRRVVAADASDPAFWTCVDLAELEQVMLALTNHAENKLVGKMLREQGYTGRITAIVRFEEEAQELAKYAISSFNLFAEAGSGFATHADSKPAGPGLES